MSAVFHIPVGGFFDGSTVPAIQSVKRNDVTGIYQVSYASLNGNLGVIDVEELMRLAYGATPDDFLIAQVVLTDILATQLTVQRFAFANPPSQLPKASAPWDFKTHDELTPFPFVLYTGEKIVLASDNSDDAGQNVYLVVVPVASSDLIEAACCVEEAEEDIIPE